MECHMKNICGVNVNGLKCHRCCLLQPPVTDQDVDDYWMGILLLDNPPRMRP